jgi:hypothetical protein
MPKLTIKMSFISYPEERYQKHLSGLEDGSILEFQKKKKDYLLSLKNGTFLLKLPIGQQEFDSLEHFWDWFITAGGLCTFSSKAYIPCVFAKYIINHNNEIRKKGLFSYQEYTKIHSWESSIYETDLSQDIYWQQCCNCKEKVSFMARYPKSLCNSCLTKVTDEEGRAVVYYNTAAMGTGCQGYYSNSNLKEFYNSPYCYIGKQQYRPSEARFGGIVICYSE